MVVHDARHSQGAGMEGSGGRGGEASPPLVGRSTVEDPICLESSSSQGVAGGTTSAVEP